MGQRFERVLRVAGYLVYLGVFVILGTELVLRVFELAPSDGVFTVSDAEFERVPGIFSPSRSLVVTRIPALEHRVTIDSLGYRGREDFPRERPEGELRIVVAGDSFAWGDYVDDDETLPAQLERALQGSCPKVRVINAGVPSTTINAQAEMVVRSLSVDPQVAVVLFQDGDLVELLTGDMWAELEQNRRTKSRFPLSVAYPVLRNTALWHLGLEVRRRMLLSQQDLLADKVENPASVAEREAEAKPVYRDRLESLRDTLVDRGIPLVLAAYPGSDALHSEDAAAVGKWAVDAARSLGLPAVNFEPMLSATGLSDEELYLYPHDGHPSPLGYELAADVLAEELLTVPTVGERCGEAGPSDLRRR